MDDKSLIRVESQEEVEVTRKALRLEEISSLVAQRELDLQELTLSLNQFEYEYSIKVGYKYVEIEELEARIAAYNAQTQPENVSLHQAASKAEARAASSRRDYEHVQNSHVEVKKSTGTKVDIRNLYLELARIIHPDMAEDDSSIPLRTRLMAALNEARSANDLDWMLRIRAEWETQAAHLNGVSLAERIVRLDKAISNMERRLRSIDREFKALASSDLYRLREQVMKAEQSGVDLLSILAKEAEEKMALLKADIREMELLS